MPMDITLEQYLRYCELVREEWHGCHYIEDFIDQSVKLALSGKIEFRTEI